jgi:hypothetical protein
MATELCTVLNRKKIDHYLTNCTPNFARSPNNISSVWNDGTKGAIKNYLAVINYNITEPIIKNLTDTFGEKAKTFVKEEIEENNAEKLSSNKKLYTLKYWSAERVQKKNDYGNLVYKLNDAGERVPDMKFSYTLIFDNSDAINDARKGFTVEGFGKSKMFKKENEDYLIEDPKEIHYDSLEDIQFNYKYWEEICQRTQTNICLFSGATSAFKYNENAAGAESDQYKVLKDNLELNYFLKKSANIFISCENLCLAAKLNSQFYKMGWVGNTSLVVKNLPCIGFDDLVITYNSNIIFCRSLISSFYPKTKNSSRELQSWFNLDSLLTANRNYRECNIFDKDSYDFRDDNRLSELINSPINEANIKAYINVGNDEEKNRRKDEVLNLLEGTFFNSEKTKKEIINELAGNLNANKFRIAYKDIFLISPHCNECSKERLIGIVTENNNNRLTPLQEVHFVKDNERRTFLSESKVLPKKTCIWCGNGKCSKTENPENIRYELGINYKIFAELLIQNNAPTNKQRFNFYKSLNAELPGLIENPYRFEQKKIMDFIKEKLIASGIQQISEVNIEDYKKYANNDPSLYKMNGVVESMPENPPLLERSGSLDTKKTVTHIEPPRFFPFSPRFRQQVVPTPPPLTRSLSQQAGGTRKYRKQNKKQSKKKNPTNSKKRYHKKSKKTRKSRK